MKIQFLFGFLILSSCLYANEDQQKDLVNLLPKTGEVENWKPAYTPQTYKGDDLFTYINGGAEIYHEYGFSKVVYNEYKDHNDHSINVEIYEMKNSASAFGIYSFKIGTKGEKIAIGNDGFLQSYYMNFWKDRFIVTLTGFDEDETTINGIKLIANIIDKKMKVKGKKPQLVNLLPKENLQNTKIKYLKGILALFNQYNFGAENIFGISEGVIGTYDDFQLFIFKYRDNKESKKYFENVKNKLQTNTQFTNFFSGNNKITLNDQKGKYLSIQPFLNFIVILLSEDQTENEKRFESVKNHINKISE